MRVRPSKLRRERGAWNYVVVPLGHTTIVALSGERGQRNRARGRYSLVRHTVLEVFWIASSIGKTDAFKLSAGATGVSPLRAARGLRAGPQEDLV